MIHEHPFEDTLLAGKDGVCIEQSQNMINIIIQLNCHTRNADILFAKSLKDEC